MPACNPCDHVACVSERFADHFLKRSAPCFAFKAAACAVSKVFDVALLNTWPCVGFLGLTGRVAFSLPLDVSTFNAFAGCLLAFSSSEASRASLARSASSLSRRLSA